MTADEWAVAFLVACNAGMSPGVPLELEVGSLAEGTFAVPIVAGLISGELRRFRIVAEEISS